MAPEDKKKSPQVVEENKWGSGSEEEEAPYVPSYTYSANDENRPVKKDNIKKESHTDEVEFEEEKV